MADRVSMYDSNANIEIMNSKTKNLRKEGRKRKERKIKLIGAGNFFEHRDRSRHRHRSIRH